MPRRVLLAVISALAVVFAMLSTASTAAGAASGCVVTTGSTGYTVTVCLTAPADGAVLTGQRDRHRHGHRLGWRQHPPYLRRHVLPGRGELRLRR